MEIQLRVGGWQGIKILVLFRQRAGCHQQDQGVHGRQIDLPGGDRRSIGYPQEAGSTGQDPRRDREKETARIRRQAERQTQGGQ